MKFLFYSYIFYLFRQNINCPMAHRMIRQNKGNYLDPPLNRKSLRSVPSLRMSPATSSWSHRSFSQHMNWRIIWQLSLLGLSGSLIPHPCWFVHSTTNSLGSVLGLGPLWKYFIWCRGKRSSSAISSGWRMKHDFPNVYLVGLTFQPVHILSWTRKRHPIYMNYHSQTETALIRD